MKYTALFLLLFLLSCTHNPPTANSNMEFKKIPVTYPYSRKDTTVSDNYFGQKIKDPYRWLEDDQSPETKDWVQKQNLVTFGYLSQIPFREKIKARLEKVYNFEKYTPPFKKAGKYYYFKNDGLQNQNVLYVQETLDGPATIVLDPNTFSADGTVSMMEYSFSKDGRYLAYATSTGGSDWRTIQVKDLQTGQMLADKIEWVKFSEIFWEKDGFYYSAYPAPKKGDELKGVSRFCKVFYHKIGNQQAADQLVYEDKQHPDRFFSGFTTADQRFLGLTGSETTSGNTLQVKDLSAAGAQFTSISDNFEHDFILVNNIDDKLLVLTNFEAPNQRLMLIDPRQPAQAGWKTFIPEDSTDVLQTAQICGDKILCTYLHNASTLLRAYTLEGKFLQDIKLPEIGTLLDLNGEKGENEAFFSFHSFLRPLTIYRLDMNTLETSVFKAPRVDFNPDAYMTEQLWFTSKDGTRVPMFVTRKKHIAMDGQNPTLLYGYGGFNIPLTPGFNVSRAMLLENNGIYVVVNLRGGGEFGSKWYEAGTKCRKQNVFDDFIAAAEYLVSQKYTSPARLAIQGGSNGGLLVGACMTQRPDLFGVCLAHVGVMDMLRYHQFTIGRAWSRDYGLSENEEEFKCLIKYSPLHNLKKTTYPSTLIITADHDDRVVPAHSFKFAATLQEYQQGDKPTLIRVETSAGHGAGKPTAKIIEETSDIYAFLFYEWKMKVVY